MPSLFKLGVGVLLVGDMIAVPLLLRIDVGKIGFRMVLLVSTKSTLSLVVSIPWFRVFRPS